MELPPALVPLSAFCIFPKYALYRRRTSVLPDWGGGLLPTTFLGFPHGGVTGQVRVLVPVGLVWGCRRWGLSPQGEWISV